MENTGLVLLKIGCLAVSRSWSGYQQSTINYQLSFSDDTQLRDDRDASAAVSAFGRDVGAPDSVVVSDLLDSDRG